MFYYSFYINVCQVPDENQMFLNGWQLAKMEKSIPDMSLPWNL